MEIKIPLVGGENLNIKERKKERTERWVEGEGGMN